MTSISSKRQLGPGVLGTGMTVCRRHKIHHSLFQRSRDRLKCGLEVAADAGDYWDDCERNSCRDQSILNGSRPRFILDKRYQSSAHLADPCVQRRPRWPLLAIPHYCYLSQVNKMITGSPLGSAFQLLLY
jgi:hypothetical protein